MYICLESDGALPEVGGGGREAGPGCSGNWPESPLCIHTDSRHLAFHGTGEVGGRRVASLQTTRNLRTSDVGPKAFFHIPLLRSDNVKKVISPSTVVIGRDSFHCCCGINTKRYYCGQRANWSLQSVAVALAQVVGFFGSVSDNWVYM